MDEHDWQIPRQEFIHSAALRSKIAWDRETLEAHVNMVRATCEFLCMTAGNFDPLHWGHIDGFYQGLLPDFTEHLFDSPALFVCVDSDRDVQCQKGLLRPHYPLIGRVSMLAALDCVTCVIPFRGGKTDAMIESVRPDWFFKGDDRSWQDTPEREILTRLGITMHRVQRRITVTSTGLAR